MSAEPTDEQRQAAVETIGYFWHPDVWDNLCSCYPRRDHPVPGDDCILLTAENVARALAAAVTAEREKLVAAVNNVHPEVVYKGQRWCGGCADPGYGGVLYPCPTIEAIRFVTGGELPRILVTGSRNWTDEHAIDELLAGAYIEYGMSVLVSGACPTGADAIAERIWESHGFPVERHPADWERYGKAAGPKRNQEMVDLGAVVCLAFPLPGSRGTKHCMAAAEKAGIPIVTPAAARVRQVGA